MAAMQAAAVAKTPDHGLGLSWEDKLTQAGALAAFFACHQNGMSRRHEPAKRQMFPYLHAFLGHDAAYSTGHLLAAAGIPKEPKTHQITPIYMDQKLNIGTILNLENLCHPSHPW